LDDDAADEDEDDDAPANVAAGDAPATGSLDKSPPGTLVTDRLLGQCGHVIHASAD